MNETFRSPGRAVVRKAELQIFGSQGRAKVPKRNFTSLKVPADIKCEVNISVFRSPGRVEERKAELQIFGSKDRTELRKRSSDI